MIFKAYVNEKLSPKARNLIIHFIFKKNIKNELINFALIDCEIRRVHQNNQVICFLMNEYQLKIYFSKFSSFYRDSEYF